MSNGDRLNRRLTHKEVLDAIGKGFRPLLKRPMTTRQSQALAVAEAWDDMARAAQGKRILQRLNAPLGGVSPARSTGRFQTFGGLQPTLPPRPGIPRGPKAPPLGKSVFGGPGMKRARRFKPKLPGYKPKGLPPAPQPPKGWQGPRGQIDPLPRQVRTMPWAQRQPWLRGYYQANPLAAAAARSEARRMVDWAHRMIR